MKTNPRSTRLHAARFRRSLTACSDTLLSSLPGRRGRRAAKDRLIIDTHLEVWTLDPKFPFDHPERPNLNGHVRRAHRESGRADEGLRTEVRSPDQPALLRLGQLLYQLLAFTNIRSCSSPMACINPEDPNVAERLRYWVKEHGFQGMRFSPIYHPKSTWLNSKEHYPLGGKRRRLSAVFNYYILPHQMPMLEDMAGRFPGVKIVDRPSRQARPEAAPIPGPSSARCSALKKFPQVWISASEPYELSLTKEYPYRDTIPFFKAIYEEFGGKQLIWGTGYPRPRWELPMDKELEFVDKSSISTRPEIVNCCWERTRCESGDFPEQ